MAPQYMAQEEVNVHGYQPRYAAMDEVYEQVKDNQLAYLASRASQHPTYQLVPKVKTQDVLSLQPKFEPSAVKYNVVSSPFIAQCDHD